MIGVWRLVFGVWCLVFGVWDLGFGVKHSTLDEKGNLFENSERVYIQSRVDFNFLILILEF